MAVIECVIPATKMFEKQSLRTMSGMSLVASLTMAGRSNDAYIISGAMYSSEDRVT